MKKKVYIGFMTYAGYDSLIVSESEDTCWKEMKKLYYQNRKTWGGSTNFHTFKEAIEWFGYRVEAVFMDTMIDYNGF